MSPSVSPEAEWELAEGALFYAREGGAELGLAFITEFERTLALLIRHAQLVRSGGSDAACPCVGSHTASSTMSEATNCASLRWPTIGAGQNTGRVGSSLRPNKPFNRSAQELRSRVPSALRAPAPG